MHQINPIARIHHGNFAAYRFNKHSFTKPPLPARNCLRQARAGWEESARQGWTREATPKDRSAGTWRRADEGGRGTRPGRTGETDGATGETAGAVALGEAAGVDAGGVPRVRALLSLGRGRARARA